METTLKKLKDCLDKLPYALKQEAAASVHEVHNTIQEYKCAFTKLQGRRRKHAFWADVIKRSRFVAEKEKLEE